MYTLLQQSLKFYQAGFSVSTASWGVATSTLRNCERLHLTPTTAADLLRSFLCASQLCLIWKPADHRAGTCYLRSSWRSKSPQRVYFIFSVYKQKLVGNTSREMFWTQFTLPKHKYNHPLVVPMKIFSTENEKNVTLWDVTCKSSKSNLMEADKLDQGWHHVSLWVLLTCWGCYWGQRETHRATTEVKYQLKFDKTERW